MLLVLCYRRGAVSCFRSCDWWKDTFVEVLRWHDDISEEYCSLSYYGVKNSMTINVVRTWVDYQLRRYQETIAQVTRPELLIWNPSLSETHPFLNRIWSLLWDIMVQWLQGLPDWIRNTNAGEYICQRAPHYTNKLAKTETFTRSGLPEWCYLPGHWRWRGDDDVEAENREMDGEEFNWVNVYCPGTFARIITDDT